MRPHQGLSACYQTTEETFFAQEQLEDHGELEGVGNISRHLAIPSIKLGQP